MADMRSNEEEIFKIAQEIKTPESRDSYLQMACGDNELLKQRVIALLKVTEEEASFLEEPVAEIVATDIHSITEQPGDVIGPHKLLQQIGEGGMGTVFMAEQTEPVERRVALKIIKPGMDTQQVIARFEAERQALAMMDHPNIAKVLDAGTTDTGRPYFVMELVKGVPITDYCDEQYLTPKQRLELFIPVCQAVQHAHQKGIIHRDLKPSNILVAQYDGKPVPKVIDFGVAKAISQKLTEKTMFTQYGQIVGTVEYMSPEQAQLNQMDVDTRSDVYSLGVLMYELLTGETPFDKQRLRSAAFDELLRIIRDEEPPRPSLKLSSSQSLPTIAANRHIEPHKLSTLVRGELDWIVMKALEKDRGRRYETPSQFAEDVQHYLNDEAVAACPPSAAYKFRKFARRNKAVIATTAAIALTLIAGIAGTTWQAYRATVEAERADQEAANARTEAAIAQAVNDFLNYDLLGMADAQAQVEADISPDPNLKVRTLLDRAAERIEGRLPDQPLVEAAIRYMIGKTYRSIGAFEEAEKHSRRSLELRRQELGSEHPLTLASVDELAIVDVSNGRYDQAEELFRQTLEIRKRTLGNEHPDTLTSMMNLAGINADQGRYAEAEQLHEKSLKIRRQSLGGEHPKTLLSMMNLAALYEKEGRYTEAEQLHEQTLEIQQRTLGDKHPHTLRSMKNLALVYRDQGRYADAQDLYQQTIDLQRKTLGSDHPDTLASMTDLATVFHEMGRYAEAEELYQQTLDVRLRTQGDEHPDTLVNQNNLANLYKHQGKYDEAEQLHQQILEIKGRSLRAEHPSLLTSMNNLAGVYSAQGRSADAQRLYQTTLEIQRRTLGEEHPDTLLTMNNLASVYADQARYEDSIQMYQHVLEIERRKLGNEHPLTLVSQSGLANLYSEQGRYTEAEDLYQRILTIRRRFLGEEHPETLFSMGNLANAYKVQGRYDEALKLQQQALEAIQRTLGEEHPETLKSIGNLASVFYDQQQYADAEQLYQHALEIQQRTLGNDHPDTICSISNLANVRHAQQRYEEAEKLYQKVLELRRRILGEEHPATLYSMNSLGVLYRSQGRYAEAEQMHQQALKIQQQMLGDTHPDTLRNQSNLAYLFYCEGRDKEAEQLQQQTLKLQRQVLGEEHPHTIESISNLAYVYRWQGRYDEAEKLHLQTLELRRKTLGDEHPQTLNSMNKLANVYWSQERYDEAGKLHQRTLELRRKILGDEHPRTLDSMSNLAGVYFAQGRFDQAEELYRQELELELRILGEEHPNTLESMNALAMVYGKQGRHSEAGQLYERIIEIQRRTLGEEHPETLASMHELAAVYHAQRRYADAEEFFRRTLELRRKVLGDEDRATLFSMNSLACLYDDQRRFAEAEHLHEQTLEIRRRVLGDAHPDTQQSIRNLVNTLQDWAWQVAGSAGKSAEDYARSLQLARRAVELDPQRIAVWQVLGWAHYRNGNWQDSIEALEKSCELQHGGDNFQWFFLAMNHWQLGHEKEAHQWYIKSVDWLYRRNSGYGYRREAEELMGLTADDRYRMLKNHYQQASDAAPNNPQLYVARSRMHKEHQNWAAAVDDSRKAVVLFRQQKPKKAVLVKTQEHLGDCLRGWGKSLQNSGQFDEAKAAYREGLNVWQELTDEFPQKQTYANKLGDFYRQLGHVLNQMGKGAEALTCFDHALEAAPNDPWSHHTLAGFRLYAQDESFRDAAQAARHAARAVELNPKSFRNYRHLGEARFRLQDWSGTVESLEKAIELGCPPDSNIGFELAICYGQLDKQEQAAEWYAQGVALMEKQKQPNASIVELRKEAESLLGLATPQTVKN
jgi:tetratricopeptide (TPR) repeat protein/tRNA A-37 threonylcarbamoyl transferase component Bud32